MNQNSSVGPNPTVNVDVPERAFSFALGSWLLSNSLKKGNFGIFRLALAGYLLYRGYSGHCAIYGAMNKPKLIDPVKNINIRTSLTVNRPHQELFSFWKHLENLPLFMKHLESVKRIDDRTSHWVAKIPGGLGTISWDAVVVHEEDGNFIGWNSLPGALVENAGKVEFKPISQDWTELDIVITYRAPMGPAGQGLAFLLNPAFEKIIQSDIKNFKFFMEKDIASQDGELIGRKTLVG